MGGAPAPHAHGLEADDPSASGVAASSRPPRMAASAREDGSIKSQVAASSRPQRMAAPDPPSVSHPAALTYRPRNARGRGAEIRSPERGNEAEREGTDKGASTPADKGSAAKIGGSRESWHGGPHSPVKCVYLTFSETIHTYTPPPRG